MKEDDGQLRRADVERERAGGEMRTEARISRLFGRACALLGIAAALAGDLTPADVGPVGPLGLLMGALGYFLGARRLGIAALLLSAAEIVVGYVN